jgi:hypothetical protein
MAYYPIKCPYCLRTHTNESVRFNLRDAMVIATRTAMKSENEENKSASSGKMFNTLNSGSDWDDDTDQAASPTAKGNKSRFPKEGYYTLSELKNIFGEENVKAEYKPVNALPALTSADYSDDLLMRVTITVNEEGTQTDRFMADRYCDCDAQQPRKLSTSSGSVPSYVILLMGSRQSGKTMYLISLFHSLRKDGGYKLPPSAVLNLETLSDSNAQMPISRMERDLFFDGILPRSTVDMTNEPLVMDVTLKFKTKAMNKALLFFRDIPGEYLTDVTSQEIKRIANQFPRFDGFVLVLDPMTFEEGIFGSGRDDQRYYIDRLKEVIVGSVIPNMNGNNISQPTAVIVTKGDKFFERENIINWRNKGIPPANPVLAAGLNDEIARKNESFDKSYFEDVNTGVLQLLDRLSRNVPNFINTQFDNAFYTMVSALGKRAPKIDIANEKVMTPTAISPWRVADPMLRLLMKLNIIPPYDQTNVRSVPTEKPDERKARRYRNNSLLNEWGEKYCTAWVNIPVDA